MSLPNEFKRLYVKQKYGLVGRHSAVKTCHWVRKSLNSGGNEPCYKQIFYNIPCHRCLQMTPSLGHCTQSCIFCWRATPETLGVSWDQTQPIKNPEDPDEIVEGCLKIHKKALSGFGGNPNVSKKMFEESLNPIHAAISLEGEPTLYPNLGQLVDSFYRYGFKSVFIVTNGIQPDILEKLETEPSQLYVSVCAPDEETYYKTCRPAKKDGWQKLMKTLEILHSFKCPTVLRHTLLPKFNMKNPEGYGKLADFSNATYLEPKAAMSVGAARDRFRYDEMAWFKDILSFAKQLSLFSGYDIIDEHRWSNIVLLSRRSDAIPLY